MKLTHSAFTKLVLAATSGVATFPLWISAAIADAPAMNITEYELTSNTVEECVNAAEIVMKQQGFEELNISTRDVFGVTGDIAVEMYCVQDGKTLVLVIAGPNPEELQTLQSQLDKIISQ